MFDLPTKVWLANEIRVWGVFVTAFVGLVSFAANWTHSRWQAELSAQKEQAASELQRKSDEHIAEAQEKAATANLEAALLKTELNREIAKRAPRRLEGEKREAFIGAIRGKIPLVYLYVDKGGEAEYFANTILMSLSEAGVAIRSGIPRPRSDFPRDIGERLVPLSPAFGVLMYAPGFTGDTSNLSNDPLQKALEAGGLAGGNFVGPNLLDGFDAAQYAIYVTEKPPW